MRHVAVRQLDTLLEAAQCLGRWYAIHESFVLLLHTGARMRHRLCPVAIVGQQQQPLRITVQPPDRE